MKIVVPMAGRGERFDQAGYKQIKPLIKVAGKRIIEYVCDMFNTAFDEFVFIINDVDYRAGDVHAVLEKYVKHYKILSVASHSKGPVWTVFTTAIPYIEQDEPVIIVYCDTPLVWDYQKFLDFSKYKDGVLASNVGFHPHSLASTMMAFSKTNSDNRITEVKEKSCYTSNHFQEHASAGLYYFKKGSYVLEYFQKAINFNMNHNGEYYVTLVYNLMIRDGLDVFSYPVDTVLAFGTPSEVQNFEAWMTILKEGQVKNTKDLLDCYTYWGRYVKNKPQR